MNERANILELNDFDLFVSSEKFDRILCLISRYHIKFNQMYAFDSWTDHSSLQSNLTESLEKSIKSLMDKVDKVDLVNKLVTLFQLKNL